MKPNLKIAIDAISGVALLSVAVIVLSFVVGLFIKAVIIAFNFGYGLI